jgi:hypothetical protein
VKRRPFAIVAALLLLPCVAVCVPWARIYAVEDMVVWQGTGAAWSAVSAQGWVVVEWNRSNWSGLPAERYGLRYERASPPTRAIAAQIYALSVGPRDTWVHRQWRGFAYTYWRSWVGGNSIGTLVLPFWAVAGAALLPLLAGLVGRAYARVRRRRCVRRGRCPSCGYDLRASPERCPECGEPAQVTSPPAQALR